MAIIRQYAPFWLYSRYCGCFLIAVRAVDFV